VENAIFAQTTWFLMMTILNVLLIQKLAHQRLNSSKEKMDLSANSAHTIHYNVQTTNSCAALLYAQMTGTTSTKLVNASNVKHTK